jgi:hypothetical protein
VVEAAVDASAGVLDDPFDELCPAFVVDGEFLFLCAWGLVVVFEVCGFVEGLAGWEDGFGFVEVGVVQAVFLLEEVVDAVDVLWVAVGEEGLYL